MRILLTVPWGERLGGGEVLLQTIVASTDRHAHDLEFVYLQDGSWPRELAASGFRVEVLPPGRLREPAHVARTVARLRRVLRQRRPDLLVNWAGTAQLYGAPAAMASGMSDRNVWFQHAIPSPGRMIDLCSTLLPAAGVFCCSRAVARAQERLLPHRRTFIVNPGVTSPRAEEEPAPLDLPDDVPVVGIVGRLQPWKGQDRLLRAQALLRQRGLRSHLLIVGGDAYGLSPGYAASLPALVRELGLTDSVTLTGAVPDAGPYIARMDVLVNASDPEPFGIVLLEAMARAVPVLAVASGGPADIIDDGRTGVLARSGEPLDLADSLEALLRSAEQRRRIALAGHELYLADFTETALQRRFFDHLESIAGNRGSGA